MAASEDLAGDLGLARSRLGGLGGGRAAQVVGSNHEPSHCRCGMWLLPRRMLNVASELELPQTVADDGDGADRVRPARRRRQDDARAILPYAVRGRRPGRGRVLGHGRARRLPAADRARGPGARSAGSLGFPASSARFAPNPVYVELVPAPAAPPTTRKPPKKKLQRPATAAVQPRAAAPTTTASAAPPAEATPAPAPADRTGRIGDQLPLAIALTQVPGRRARASARVARPAHLSRGRPMPGVACARRGWEADAANRTLGRHVRPPALDALVDIRQNSYMATAQPFV